MRKITILFATFVLILVLAVSIGAFAASDDTKASETAVSQQGNQPGDRAERMAQMMKEQLGVSDDEWTVIGPRVTKVMKLSRQVEVRGGMRMMGGRGQGAGGPDQSGPPADERRPQEANSEVQTAAESLNTVLEKTDSTNDEITAKLTALRTAKEKVKQELSKAQQELKAVLTLRQEAKLVAMGLLN